MPRADAAGRERFLRDLAEGLSQPHKSVPSVYFYDARGARLFETIRGLPEYDLSRNESAILADRGGEIAAALGRRCVLIEPGSGSAAKTRVLLRAMARPAAYVPIDVSGEQLGDVSRELRGEFPGLRVRPVWGDFTRGLRLPRWLARRGNRGVFFPGSTIGNFGPRGRRRLLRRFARLAGEGGAVVLGVDLVKDPAEMVAAYDDAQGVTAAFNLNLLARANRELGTTFDLEAFRHEAVWDADRRRIEMRLVCLEDQAVLIGDRLVRVRHGERIRTEWSYKFTVRSVGREAKRAGLRVEHAWTDARERFAVVLLRAAGVWGWGARRAGRFG